MSVGGVFYTAQRVLYKQVGAAYTMLVVTGDSMMSKIEETVCHNTEI